MEPITIQLSVIQAYRSRLLGAIAACLVLAVACTSATVTPEPTPVPTPAPTVAPSSTVTPEHGQAGLTALDLASADAFAELEKFLEELGPRESATAQAAVAAEYLQDRF